MAESGGGRVNSERWEVFVRGMVDKEHASGSGGQHCSKVLENTFSQSGCERVEEKPSLGALYMLSVPL